MYQHFGASDISTIHSFGVSIQFWPTLTLLSATEIDCAFIKTDIAKTVTGKFWLGFGDIYDGVGQSDRLFSRQYVKKNED